MSSFKGQYQYSLDDKGRVNIPAKFRKALPPEANETFMVTRGLEQCLFVYPLDEWKKIEDKLRGLSMTQKNHRLFVRMMTAHASEGQFDKQGRIPIPAPLLQIAGIQKEVIIIGALDHIEIWATHIFMDYIEKSSESYEQIAETIMF